MRAWLPWIGFARLIALVIIKQMLLLSKVASVFMAPLLTLGGL